MVRLACVLSSFVLLLLVRPAAAQDPTARLNKVHKIAVGGDGGWDYLSVDAGARRLYVSRNNRIVVLDIDQEKVVGELADTPGVHGVAVAPNLSRGFTSNGGDDSVTAFDLKTLKVVGKVKVGSRPDAIHFDPESNRVFTFNHGSKDATAVDPAGITVAGAVALEGVPEAAVSDGKGRVFVNLMDKSEIAEFDARTLKVLNRWSLSPGERPTGLAMDREHRRLFSVCANQKMIVVDADSGRVIATVDIGRGTDGCAFDPETGLAFSSNGGDGTVSVVREQGAGKFGVAATIPTQSGARTMALDPKTHRLYLSSATVAPAAPAPAPADQTKKKGRGRNYVPGSFVIVVVGD